MLTIRKTLEGETAVIALQGRLDTVTSPELEQELTELLPGLKELTLDFSELDYISSAGLRVLLSAQKKMLRQGQMSVVHVNDAIMEIFEVTGFLDILTIR